MKIYLVTPRNPESFWTFDRILPSLGKKCAFPNLSMPTVAGLTPPHHQVICCDENVEEVDFSTDADVVGITGYIVHKRRMFELIDEFKKRGRLVAVGGPFASLCPEELRGRADVVFIDEAEYTWPQFLDDFERGEWTAEYRQHEKPGMPDSPTPRFDLLRLDAYRAATLQFARGCPYACEFCDITVLYGRRPRNKTVDQVMTEIQTLHGLGVGHVFVVDDNFIGNRREAKLLLRTISDWQAANRRPIEFLTQVSINVAQDEELLALLADANFKTLFIGIESPRAASLKESNKTQNLRGDLVAAVHRIQSHGLEVMAGMIVGFDHDDASIFEEQFQFIQQARIPISMTGMLNAMPKTPLHARLGRDGRLAAESVGDQFVFTNVVPASMSQLELYEGYRSLLRRLYGHRNYWRRARGLLLHLGDASDRLMTGVGDARLFGSVLWTCLFRASPRRAGLTLALLAETLLRRPRRFRRAVGLALMHKHLHEYVEHTTRRIDALVAELRAAATTPS